MLINVILKAKWQLKNNPNYKITECKRVVNSKTGKILKYSQRGYFINGRYYKKKDISMIYKYLGEVKLFLYHCCM